MATRATEQPFRLFKSSYRDRDGVKRETAK